MAFFAEDWLFPVKCAGCGKEDERELLCRECLGEIKINQTLFCGKCRARLPENQKICHKDFPYILGMAADYDDKNVSELISGLKFKFWEEAARPLGKILIKYAENLPLKWKEALIVPVPLSKKRERERGFNQSEILAEILARNFGCGLDVDNLERTKNAKPQSEMDFYRRKENVRGVFAVKGKNPFSNRKIILVDDVVTSGATLFEATIALKNAGVKSVVAIAVAGA